MLRQRCSATGEGEDSCDVPVGGGGSEQHSSAVEDSEYPKAREGELF